MKRAWRILCVGVLVMSMIASLTVPGLATGNTSINITWADMFGDQDGVLTLDPAGQTWSLSFENPYGSHTVSGIYSDDGTMELTNDNGEGQFLPFDTIKQVGEEAVRQFLSGAAPASGDVPIDITWADMFGDQDGVLTLDPAGQTWSLSFENPYGSHTVSGIYSDDGTMELTNDNGEGQFLPFDTIKQVGEEAIRQFLSGTAPAGGNVSIDITWADMFGNQDGVLTLDPAGQTWSLSFENPYGSHTVSGIYSDDGMMELTNDNGEGQFLPFDTIKQVGEEVIRQFLSGTAPTKVGEKEGKGAEMASAANAFDDYKTIVTWDVLDFPMVFEQLPDAYNTYDTQYKGTEMFVEYTTDVYEDGVTYDKFARVYLPYGYDPEDTETKYNVVYLQHANNCTPSSLFDIAMAEADFIKLLDNMFDPEHGVMEPFIVVCPTYYLDLEKMDLAAADGAIAGDGRYDGIPGNYDKEVIEDLIPAVESQLNVYCDDFSAEGIAATRDHRAWGGFSRGSVCTWYMFHNAFEYFRYWLPNSAGCVTEGVKLGDPDAELADNAAIEYLKEAIEQHSDLPFYIIAQSGGPQDAASMRTQMKHFVDRTDVFSYGLNPEVNNFYYTCSNFQHTQQCMAYYLYTARNILFK